MRHGPLSRCGLVVGGVAVLGASRPGRRVEAMAAEVQPAGGSAIGPMTFDPAAFINDLLSTGHCVALHQPVWLTGDPDEDLRPYFWVYPQPGGGFNRAYGEVMARWAGRLDATPDHVERVVAHLRERIEGQGPG